MRVPSVVVALTALLLPLAARAGVVLKGREPQSSRKVVVELDGRKLRLEEGKKGERTVVFDADARRILDMEPRDRVYRILDPATAKRKAERLERQLSQMTPAIREEALKTVPPRPDTAKHEWSLKATGASGTAAGRACTTYRVLKDGGPDQADGASTEVCLIPWSAELPRAAFAAWPALNRFLARELWPIGPKYQATPPVGGDLDSWFGSAPGFPGLVHLVQPDGTRRLQWELVEVAARKLAADRFKVPAGFKQLPADETEG